MGEDPFGELCGFRRESVVDGGNDRWWISNQTRFSFFEQVDGGRLGDGGDIFRKIFGEALR